MHLLGLLVPILIMCIVWYSRFHLIVEMLNDIEAGIRSWRANRRRKQPAVVAEPVGLSAIKDPATAAAVLLYSIANEADVKDASHDEIVTSLLADIIPTGRLADCLAAARASAGDVTDARDVVRKFKSLWRGSLDAAERRQLVAMAETIAAVGAPPNLIQRLCVASLREAFGEGEQT